MSTALFTLALASSLLSAGEPLTTGTQLHYRGAVAPLDEDGAVGEPQKSFDLTLLLAGVGRPDARAYWLVEERGRGNWPWVERFGASPVDAAWQAEEATLPALLYDGGETKSTIPLELPMFVADRPLSADLTWETDRWSYLVVKDEEIDGRATWKVQVSNSYGPKRTVWVEREGALVVGLTERVFMGMGQEFELRMRLQDAEQVAEDKLAALAAGYDAMIALRGQLDREPREESGDWNDKQLELLAEHLPAAEQAVTGGGLVKLVKAARRDLELQAGRASAVGRLAAEQEGRTVEAFEAEGTSREKLSEADLAGRVTILHFWDYREPLEEPYGQIGYLDFLFNQRQGTKLQVYGVAVDARLAEEDTRSAAVRGVKKVKSFMNLSYPVLLDEGRLIKQFGDPRLLGAELPLFVVIGSDGTIVHYHVGFYEVDRNQGLKALDEIVNQALQQAPAE